VPKDRRQPVIPTETPPDQVEAVLAEAVARPTVGAQRLVDHLADRGIPLSAPVSRRSCGPGRRGQSTRGAAAFVDHVAQRLAEIGAELTAVLSDNGPEFTAQGLHPAP
jgi:hypothetical protein